jgi:ferredoxin-NADP reductase
VNVSSELPAARELIVTNSERVADEVVQLTLRDPFGDDLPEWRPGAHIDIEVGAEIWRQYSLCGSMDNRDEWAIAVLREQNSRGGSEFLHSNVVVGSRLVTRGPRSHFVLSPAPAYVFVAGGIGITPLLPMIAAAERAHTPWQLLYLGRTRSSMAYAQMLVADYGSRVKIIAAAEDGRADIDAFLAGRDTGTQVYCCGPDRLMTAVVERCAALGLTAQTEHFAADAAALERTRDSFDLVLASSGTTVRVGADQTMLSAIASAGVELGWSCLEGTCGTCEARILDGCADHRDAVLSDEEKRANNYVMTCVSRCIGEKLTLDL